ncbi:nuclear transport factor 2 family protein [uncultured Dokdonia sp.]|uniref:nuclear transport factor 2 family protein n=1 Tax=uncultured Dokdonia sp. TaxID=575653 RepID=UPI0026352758|nr:nuclear transport factor 2 family protein [uncultured Dokdonia sp.]
MKKVLIALLMIPMILLGQNADTIQEMELEKLNEYLFTEYALHKNTKPLNEVATEDFVLIAAPGMIENKKQAIDGVENLSISSIHVTIDKMITTEHVGIIIGILEMKGTIMNRPVPGKIRYSSTFVKEDGVWRLKARTMTPMRMQSSKN